MNAIISGDCTECGESAKLYFEVNSSLGYCCDCWNSYYGDDADKMIQTRKLRKKVTLDPKIAEFRAAFSVAKRNAKQGSLSDIINEASNHTKKKGTNHKTQAIINRRIKLSASAPKNLKKLNRSVQRKGKQTAVSGLTFECGICSKVFEGPPGLKSTSSLTCSACRNAVCQVGAHPAHTPYSGQIRHWKCPVCRKVTDGFERYCIGCSQPNLDQIERIGWKQKNFLTPSWQLPHKDEKVFRQTVAQ